MAQLSTSLAPTWRVFTLLSVYPTPGCVRLLKDVAALQPVHECLRLSLPFECLRFSFKHLFH